MRSPELRPGLALPSGAGRLPAYEWDSLIATLTSVHDPSARSRRYHIPVHAARPSRLCSPSASMSSRRPSPGYTALAWAASPYAELRRPRLKASALACRPYSATWASKRSRLQHRQHFVDRVPQAARNTSPEVTRRRSALGLGARDSLSRLRPARRRSPTLSARRRILGPQPLVAARDACPPAAFW
jgi:hypothetical protein